MKKKAFTLIELIAVLVILAILALIVTPLVMSIIRKARIAADKRSIDAYGRSVELAIASYLLDNGNFPASINDLTIEYSGDEVICSTTQLNSDSSVYLTGCTVAGRTVNYTYGIEGEVIYDAYAVGDEISYNNVDYYVLKDSGISESTVTLLKAEPLTVAEVNEYGGVGTDNNHINVNVYSYSSSYQTAYNDSGYGGMAYYTSPTCKQGNSDSSGCINSYEGSDIKYVVDAWALDKVPTGLEEARLITMDDLTGSLGMEFRTEVPTLLLVVGTEDTPTWIFSDCKYWTSTVRTDNANEIWAMSWTNAVQSVPIQGIAEGGFNPASYPTVRPVVTIKKSALSN